MWGEGRRLGGGGESRGVLRLAWRRMRPRDASSDHDSVSVHVPCRASVVFTMRVLCMRRKLLSSEAITTREVKSGGCSDSALRIIWAAGVSGVKL